MARDLHFAIYPPDFVSRNSDFHSLVRTMCSAAHEVSSTGSLDIDGLLSRPASSTGSKTLKDSMIEAIATIR